MLKWPVSPSLAHQIDGLMDRLGPGLDIGLDSAAAGSVFVEALRKFQLEFFNLLVRAHCRLTIDYCIVHRLNLRPVELSPQANLADIAPMLLHVSAKYPDCVPRLIARLA